MNTSLRLYASRANLDYETIKRFKDNGLRLFLVGFESVCVRRLREGYEFFKSMAQR